MTGQLRTVYLIGCEAEVDGDREARVCLFGLFDIEEFWPYEPAAYVQSPTYVLASHDRDEETSYMVDAIDLEEQVNPAGWARALVQEREMELAAERDWS